MLELMLMVVVRPRNFLPRVRDGKVTMKVRKRNWHVDLIDLHSVAALNRPSSAFKKTHDEWVVETGVL